MSESLIVKYRPNDFSSIVGHKQILKSIQNTLAKNLSHSFIFTGSPGIGKTSLARIIAKEVKCKYPVEVDGASATGIDAMRDITSTLSYKSLSGESKVIIIDEAHRLSSAAITSLLKSIEEPSEHVYWILCTTELNKIPKAIQTRCQVYNLNPLLDDEICDILVKVCDAEGFNTPDDVIELIVDSSNGSARQALAFLSVCSDCESRKEALPLLNSALEDEEIINLARYLVKVQGPSWSKIQEMVKGLKGENPESIRLVIVNYISAVLMNTTNESEAHRLISIISAFKNSYNQSEKFTPLFLSLGEILFP